MKLKKLLEKSSKYKFWNNYGGKISTYEEVCADLKNFLNVEARVDSDDRICVMRKDGKFQRTAFEVFPP